MFHKDKRIWSKEARNFSKDNNQFLNLEISDNYHGDIKKNQLYKVEIKFDSHAFFSTSIYTGNIEMARKEFISFEISRLKAKSL